MSASRKTILALGLMLLTLAAGGSVLGASFIGCGGSSCEANCGTDTGGCTACQAPGNPACNSGCGAGCNASGGSVGNAGGNSCTRYVVPTTWADDIPLLGACEPYFEDLCETCRCGRAQAEASALFIHRSTPGTRAVLLDANGADLYDASRLDFPFAVGPRVSLTVLDCEGWGFESNFFFIDGWSATSDIPNGSLPGGTGTLVVDSVTNLALTNAHFESIARLYSAETNFRKPLFGNLSFLAGFRWLELTDRYLAEGTSATTRNTISETILTHNNLYGFQVGADGPLFQEADRWRITGFVKGGIFLNNADQATSLSDPGGLGSRAVNNNEISAAFFGEAGVIGYLQITKHLAASGGYQVMFVNGVAQPVNQLSGTNLANSTAAVDASAGLFYHGATAGLELTW